MANETEKQRQARLDREASRNYRTVRQLRRGASYRRREERDDWQKEHGTTPSDPEVKKP
jgi:hypothetical protein